MPHQAYQNKQRVKRKALSLLKKLTQFFCGAVYDAVQGGSNFFNLCTAVARFFVTGGGGGEGGIIASAEGRNLVVRSGCILP